MNSNHLPSQIKKAALGEGASLVGFADLTQIPANARCSLRFAVSIAVALDAAVIAEIGKGPTQNYYSEYKRVNMLLSELGQYTAALLRDCGYQAVSCAPTNVGIDPKTDSTPLPHKTVATKAGLGWIGKCALLVTQGYGSAIRLTTVLTDARLETGAPIVGSQCGDCEICVISCPGKAPSGRNWEASLHRDLFFNASACHKTAEDLAANAGIQGTICGICISVCPWTVEYVQRKARHR